jgi:hypothetical protein
VAAHEQGGRAVGVVRDVSAERLVIETADGHRVGFAVSKDTRFFRGHAPARLEDVKPGDRAAVEGKRDGGTLSALRVKLGTANARPPAPPGR